ncbi:hypothetical protein KI387_024295, partial [Taxus chinensis]
LPTSGQSWIEQRVVPFDQSDVSVIGSRSWRSGRSVRSVRQPIAEQPAGQQPARQQGGTPGAGPSQPPLFRAPGHGPGSPGE